MKIAPCKDCDHRYVGCAIGCEEYLSWRDERIKMLSAYRKDDIALSFRGASYRRTMQIQDRQRKRGKKYK